MSSKNSRPPKLGRSHGGPYRIPPPEDNSRGDVRVIFQNGQILDQERFEDWRQQQKRNLTQVKYLSRTVYAKRTPSLRSTDPAVVRAAPDFSAGRPVGHAHMPQEPESAVRSAPHFESLGPQVSSAADSVSTSRWDGLKAAPAGQRR